MTVPASSSTSFRKVRGTAYLFMVACGMVLPYQLHNQTAHPWTWNVMCAFIVLGGLTSAYGQFTGTWLGEYVGLPFVFSAIGGFGVLELALAEWTAIPSVALLWAFTFLLYARWRDVSSVFRSARKTRRREIRAAELGTPET